MCDSTEGQSDPGPEQVPPLRATHSPRAGLQLPGPAQGTTKAATEPPSPSPSPRIPRLHPPTAPLNPAGPRRCRQPPHSPQALTLTPTDTGPAVPGGPGIPQSLPVPRSGRGRSPLLAPVSALPVRPPTRPAATVPSACSAHRLGQGEQPALGPADIGKLGPSWAGPGQAQPSSTQPLRRQRSAAEPERPTGRRTGLGAHPGGAGSEGGAEISARRSSSLGPRGCGAVHGERGKGGSGPRGTGLEGGGGLRASRGRRGWRGGGLMGNGEGNERGSGP